MNDHFPKRPSGEKPPPRIRIRNGFMFPDGDHYQIWMSSCGPNRVRLFDSGHTFMRISYDHDIDEFMRSNRVRLNRVYADTGVYENSGGMLCYETVSSRLGDAVAVFGEAISRVYAFADRSPDVSMFAESGVWEC